jgi:hypothetical protein
VEAMTWNYWSLYWLVWLFFGFFLPEMYCLATGNSQNTLSDQVWHLEGTGATFFQWVVGALFLWLFLHMTFRLFR